MEKSLVGAEPKHLYELKRVQELSAAIYNYASYPLVPSVQYKVMAKWAEELVDRLHDLDFEHKYESEKKISNDRV